LNPRSNPLLKTPFASVKVVPAPTWGPKTLYDGPGIYGGYSGNQTSFVLTAFDLWGNQIADFHDNMVGTDPIFNPSGQKLYTVTISGLCISAIETDCDGSGNPPKYSLPTQANITNGVVNGTYNVTYTVPVNVIQDYSPWTDYNITIKHSGGGVTYSAGVVPYSVGPWQVTLSAKSYTAPRTSCAKLAYANGTAGSMSLWNITDFACTFPYSHIFTTPSFLVTLEEYPPPGPKTVAPIKVQCLLSDCGSKTSQNYQFNVSFTPTVNIGLFRIRLFAYGYLETNYSSTAPYLLVTIFPGPVYPPSCSVVGFPGTTPAGQAFTFTVALADQWNHPITTGTHQVSAIAKGPKGLVIPLLNATLNGQNYSFTTGSLLTTAGSWNILILEETSRNTPNVVVYIGGTLLTLVVTPGPVHDAYTYATFPAGTLLTGPNKVQFSTAGQTGYFTVFPKDQWGNDLPYPEPAATTAALTASDNGASYQTPNGPATFSWTPQQDPSNPENLIYIVGYTATKIMAPTNDITINANGVAIKGTNNGTVPTGPYRVLVDPARISAQYSTLVNGSTLLTAGVQPLIFTLNARDIWNNPWFSGKENDLNALVKIPASPGAAGSTEQMGVTDNLGGSYIFTLPASSTQQASAWSGTAYIPDYVVTLNYVAGANSQLLSGSGAINIPTYTVQAGPTDPTQTILTESPYPLIASVTRTYTVITVDQFGKRRY